MTTRTTLGGLALATALLLGASDARALTNPVGEDPVDREHGGSVWGASYFPDHVLIDQDGEEQRFFTDLIEGKVVVINFIYTSCPDTCPLETARLAEVYSILGDRVGDDVFFYSISIDPERDTPEVMKAYAEQFGAGKGWKFLTGDEDEIISLRKKLGLYRPEVAEEDKLDHNLSIVIGNQATGRWMPRSPFENAYVLANQVGSWLHNWTDREEGGVDYKDAPKVRNLTKGESLFRTRCSVCHSIGATSFPKVGPDLLGVTDRREHEWLRRWVSEPDIMLAEGDSIAMGLMAAYNNVPMPNMRLSPPEADIILDYIDAESRRRAAHAKTLEVEKKREELLAKGELESCCQKEDQVVIGREDDGDTVAGAGGAGGDGGGPMSGLAPKLTVALGVLLGALALLTARRGRGDRHATREAAHAA